MNNTLIIFYWDVATSYGFSRVHFQAVLEGIPFENMSDVQEWEESVTSKLYSEYEFNVVFSHVIVKYGPTNNEPVKVHAYKEENLKLVVDKPKRKYTKRVKPVVEIPVPEVEPVKKYDEGNWWIEPDGTYHEVGWCGHNDFAYDYLEEHHRLYFEVI